MQLFDPGIPEKAKTDYMSSDIMVQFSCTTYLTQHNVTPLAEKETLTTVYC